MQQHYNTIYAFFDCYTLSHARSIFSKMIRAADADKTWNGRAPSDLVFFKEKIMDLIKAAFAIVNRFDYKPEVMLDDDRDEKIWFLTQYELYCSSNTVYSPWDFFPRYLKKKEFLDPYKALKKFTKYRNPDQWEYNIRDLLLHSLSPNSISEFEDGTRILETYIHLHKLLEATHLIAVRAEPEKPKTHHFKWKAKEEDLSA